MTGGGPIFIVDKERALKILKNIKPKSLHLEMRIDYITREYMNQLKEINVQSFMIGVESGSDRLLKLISKGYDSKKIYSVLSILKDYDFSLKLSFILGIPTETLDEYRETLNMIVWCIENLPAVGFTLGLYLPYPGTPLFDFCVKNGFKKPETFKEWVVFDRHGKKDYNFTNVKHLTPREIRKLRALADLMKTSRQLPSTKNKTIYHICKFRFLNSGKKWMKIFNRFENMVISSKYKGF